MLAPSQHICIAVKYGETWDRSPMEVEYCKAIRAALSIRKSVNNEIVYIVSEQSPLECEIKCRQLKLWLNIKIYASKIMHEQNSIDSHRYEYTIYYQLHRQPHI